MPRTRGSRLTVSAVLVAGALGLGSFSAPGSSSPHAAAVIDVSIDPNLKFFDREVVPGEAAYVTGGDWLPSGCDNKIHLKLRDSSGDSFSLGRFKPKNPRVGFEGQEYPAALDASPTIPDGVRPGVGKVRGTQDWAFKFPGLGCFELFQISSPTRSVTVLGESGNDPPRITGFDIPNLPQGGPGAIKWTASEPCVATVEVKYLLAPGMSYDLPPVLAGYASTAGANTASYDARSEGRALPTGEYRALMQCQEANGAKSSIARETFVVGFAR